MSTHPADPPYGIEPFAVLSAQLASARAAVLRDHGLDELRWKAIEAGWAERARGEDGEALAERFRAVFSHTLHDLAACPLTEPDAAPRFLSAEAQPWRAEAAKVPPAPRPGAHPLAATIESPMGLPVPPALPFTKP